MKNALLQLSLSVALIVAGWAQGPMLPARMDIPKLPHGCSGCAQSGPVVAEELSPDYSTKLPECDRIEVFLLAENFQKGEAADRFPIRPDHGTLWIINRKELKGEEVAKLCALWRGLTFNNQREPVTCKDQVYGLRFYQSDQTVFETSVSLAIPRFYYPRTAFPIIPGGYSWHGFRTYDKAGRALIEFLNLTLQHEAKSE